jgi:hypothetical protein
MNENPASPELISEDEARGKVEQYLRQRYHEFDKVQFNSRSTLDRFVIERAAGFYTFTFEISAVNGQVINYVFK